MFKTRRRMFMRRWKAFAFAVVVLIGIGTAMVWPRVFISIDSGEAGVMYRLFYGVDVDNVMAPGFHVIFPWNTVFIYDTRKQIAHHEFDVLSSRGLKVQMSLAVRYRPEASQLGLLHERIGPDYLRRVALPQVESALRRELGIRTAEEIYTNENGLLTRALILARDEVGRNYVQADEIVIRTVVLPISVSEAIEAKLVQNEVLESYDFRLQIAEAEAERLRREAQGLSDYQATVDAGLTEQVIRYRSLRAAQDLALSPGTRLVLIGGEDGIPIKPPVPRGLDAIPPAAVLEMLPDTGEDEPNADKPEEPGALDAIVQRTAAPTLKFVSSP